MNFLCLLISEQAPERSYPAKRTATIPVSHGQRLIATNVMAYGRILYGVSDDCQERRGSSRAAKARASPGSFLEPLHCNVPHEQWVLLRPRAFLEPLHVVTTSVTYPDSIRNQPDALIQGLDGRRGRDGKLRRLVRLRE